MVGGVDEAGRGPVIGPMIICGAWIEDQDELKEIGVRDSKEMTREEREEVFKELLKVLDGFVLEAVKPKEIDRAIEMGLNLNRLELLKFSKVINRMKAEEIYVDSPYRNIKKFEEELRRITKKKIIAMNHADKKIPIVSAASIIAKVVRDRFIEILKEEVGDFGSGYPSDPKTIEFLKENWEKIKDWEYVRKSWETYKKIEKSLRQRTLLDFCDFRRADELL